jgi:hypothetical protein
MTAILAVKRLVFTKAPGDVLQTGRVQLDNPGISFRIRLRWLPQSENWILDLATTAGTQIVSGTWVRDRVDCLLGVSTAGRPPGAIMSYDPKNRGEPQLDAYTTGGAGLYYVPAGLNPEDFSLYSTEVV